jgi:hypothetical protein
VVEQPVAASTCRPGQTQVSQSPLATRSTRRPPRSGLHSFDSLNGILTIDVDNLNESVSVSNDGTNITLTGSHAITGAGGTFATADVHRIVITDTSNLEGQSIGLDGTAAFLLSGGLSSTGVETVSFNNAVTATGASSIAVTAPQSIIVSANVTGGTDGVSLIGQGIAALNTVGVTVQSGAVVSASGSGPVTVVGQGGSGTGSHNYGVFVGDPGSQITSGGGAVSVIGTGGGSGASSGYNYGVCVVFGSMITSAGTGSGATVTVVGQGGSGTGSYNYGVFVGDPGSQITSGGGAVSVIGTGGGSGAGGDNHGAVVHFGGMITSAGSGAVTVVGTGGSGASIRNYGVLVFAGGVITSAGTGSGATVTVVGAGGGGSGSFNYGVHVFGFRSQITSSGGAVSVTATGSDTAEALRLENSGSIASGGNAAITITADSVNLLSGTSIHSGAGTTTIRTRTAGTMIDLGGDDVLSGSLMTLGLTNAELNQISAGTLVIGRADAGTLSLTAAIARQNATNVELRSGSSIIFNSGSFNTTGGTLLLAPGSTPAAVQPKTTGIDARASTVSFASALAVAINGPTVDTGYDQLNIVGTVDLSGVNLVLSGGYVPLAGDVFTIVTATQIIGQFNGLAEGAVVNFNGVDLTVHYSGNAITLRRVSNAAPTLTVPPAQTAYEDADKIITGITVGHPNGDNLIVTLSVSKGRLTLTAIAGLVIRGNGTGVVTLSGSIARLNAALATLVYRGNLNFGGADALHIHVSDGRLSTTGRVAINVKSAFQQAAELRAQVTALQNMGILTKCQANRLLKGLELKGNRGDANRVRNFMTQVANYRNRGILTLTQANSLLGPGNILLLSVMRS